MLNQDFVDALTQNGFRDLALMRSPVKQMDMAIQYLELLGDYRTSMRDADEVKEVLIIRGLFRNFIQQFQIGDIVLCTIRYYQNHYFIIDFFENQEPAGTKHHLHDDEPGFHMVQLDLDNHLSKLKVSPQKSPPTPIVEHTVLKKLSEITVGAKNLQLVGRINLKSDKKQVIFGNNVSSVANFTMFDDSGEIKVVMFDTICDKYYDLIKAGQVFRISNPDIRPLGIHFSIPYELKLGTKSSITCVSPLEAERIVALPPVLPCLEEIFAIPSTRYISFFAKVDYAPPVGEKETHKKLFLLISDQNNRRRKIFYLPSAVIVDQKIVAGQVYLFERFLLKKSESDPFIQFCPILSSITTAGIQHHPIYLEFGHRLQVPQAKVRDLIDVAAANIPADTEFTVTAKIEKFGFTLYYEKCTKKDCFKKATKTGSGYECAACGLLPENPAPQLNYFGDFTITDETGSQEVRYRDQEVFIQIFKINGYQHMDLKKNNQNEFKELWNRVTNQKFKFTLITQKTAKMPTKDQSFLVVKAEDAN